MDNFRNQPDRIGSGQPSVYYNWITENQYQSLCASDI